MKFMISKFAIGLACLGSLITVESIGQKKELRLKVMTYNIRHASPPSHPSMIDIDTVSAVVNMYQPDIVALQEVDVHTGRSGKAMDEAKEIGDRTKMFHYFGRAINFDGGEYGIAILSKYPIDSAKTFQLPSANAHAEKRALALAWLNLGGNKQLLFACTHLDAEAKDDSRMMQIKAIDSLLMPQPIPLLLAGDLNSEAGSPVIEILDQHFNRSCLNNCAFTIPSDKPVQTIDYIAFRNTDAFKVIDHRVLQEPYPSDHLPVIAELSLSMKKKQPAK